MSETTEEDFVDYKLKKEVEGLKKVLKFKKEVLAYEREYVNDVRIKDNADKENIESKVDIFKKDIAAINKMLKDIAGYIEEEATEYVVPERKAWNKELKKETKKPVKTKTSEELLKGI